MNEKMNEREKNLFEQVALLESIAKKNMTKEAISRYGNLKIAHPELALRAIAAIAQAVQLGQITESITDCLLYTSPSPRD